jgi:hypothetical protein
VKKFPILILRKEIEKEMANKITKLECRTKLPKALLLASRNVKPINEILVNPENARLLKAWVSLTTWCLYYKNFEVLSREDFMEQLGECLSVTIRKYVSGYFEGVPWELWTAIHKLPEGVWDRFCKNVEKSLFGIKRVKKAE